MLEKFSEELKEARQRSEMSLQQVAARTRIDIKFLNAMENGNFSFQPELYVRAFIKDYCKAIGADEVKMIKRFDLAKQGKLEAETGEEPSAKPEPKPVSKPEPKPIPKPEPAPIPVAKPEPVKPEPPEEEPKQAEAPVEKEPEQVKQEPETKAEKEAEEKPAPVEKPVQEEKVKYREIVDLKPSIDANPAPKPKMKIVDPYNQALSQQKAPEVNKKVVLAGLIAVVLLVLGLVVYVLFFQTSGDKIVVEKPYDSVLEENKQRLQENEPKKEEPKPDAQQQTSDSLNLSINAKDTVWIKIVSDSSHTDDFMLYPHNSKQFKAKRNFRVTLGNSSGAELLLNNKPLEFQGRRKRRMDLFIDANGIKAPAEQKSSKSNL